MQKAMKIKRLLTNEEKELSEKSLEGLKKVLSYFEFQKKYLDLMITEGLEQNYLKQKHELGQKQKEVSNEIEIINSKINVILDQITHGVEAKEEKKNE